MSNDKERFIFAEDFEVRPLELMPAIVIFETSSNMDYISFGLVDPAKLRDAMRHGRYPLISVYDAKAIIRYNKESGSLYGLAKDGPVQGGYGVRVSKSVLVAVGKPLEVLPMTQKSWEEMSEVDPVS